MGAAACIGRVGGLAVALGVGVAVATGYGVASATPDSDSSPPKPSTSEPSQATGGHGSTANATPGTPAAGSPASDMTTNTTASTSTTRTPKPGEVLRQRMNEVAEQVRSALSTTNPLHSLTVNSPFNLGQPAKPNTKPLQTVTPPSATESDTLPKRSATRSPTWSADTPINRLSAPTATVQARKVGAIVPRALTTKPTSIALRPATFAAQTMAPTAQPSVVTTQSTEPVMMAASQSTIQPRVTTLLTKALSLLGIGVNPTGVPVGSPLALALLALGARRESEETFSQLARTTTTNNTPLAAAALAGGGQTAALAAAAPTAAITPDPYPAIKETPKRVSANTNFIGYVTGPKGRYNVNDTTTRFKIGGTDVGTMWDNGITDNPDTPVDEHEVLIAFGDTFGNSYPVRTGFWRMNTLLRTPDSTLSNGMYIPNTVKNDIYSGSSTIEPDGIDPKEIVDRNNIKGYAVGPEVTIIPTAGISAPGPNGTPRQYVNFMSVRSWDSAGRWTTNYSGIAYSDDNGQTWTVADSSIRPAAAGRSIKPFVNGNQNFQQGAYVEGVQVDANGEPVYDANGELQTDGYVYSYGTPSGRAGTAYLSRVAEADVLDQTKYEYWNGSTWVKNDPAAAKPILPATTTKGFFGLFKTTTYASVSEMSVQYNEYLGKYVMLYGDKNNNIVARTASTPEGPWSPPTTLVASWQMPGLYAPMIHPWSGTDNVAEADRKNLYWNLSTWGNYEVRLMQTDLTKTNLV